MPPFSSQQKSRSCWQQEAAAKAYRYPERLRDVGEAELNMGYCSCGEGKLLLGQLSTGNVHITDNLPVSTPFKIMRLIMMLMIKDDDGNDGYDDDNDDDDDDNDEEHDDNDDGDAADDDEICHQSSK